jgi:hypothetical protein
LKSAFDTREQWLNAAAAALKSHVRLAGGPDYEDPLISTGWPKGHRGRATAIGQCWDKTTSGDRTRAHIYISPTLTDDVQVLATLLHELVHASVGTGCGHKAPFSTVARACGLEGKMTATVPGRMLELELKLLAAELGAYPHPGIRDIAFGKKQTTRMLKVQCDICGCVVRMTRKWLDSVGPPTCGCGADMYSYE